MKSVFPLSHFLPKGFPSCSKRGFGENQPRVLSRSRNFGKNLGIPSHNGSQSQSLSIMWDCQGYATEPPGHRGGRDDDDDGDDCDYDHDDCDDDVSDG